MRTLVVATLALTLVAGCARDDARVVARDWLDALNAHDPDRVLALMAPGATYFEPGLGAAISGEPFRQYLARAWQVWGDRVYSARRLVAAGDAVAIEWHLQQSYANGVPLPIDGVFLLQLNGGRVTSARAYYDPSPYLRLMTQPAPKSP